MPIQTKFRAAAFSIVELMIVIAIVAALATAIILTYKDYITRARISALMPLVQSVKVDVENAHNQGTIFGTGTTQTYVSSSDPDKPSGLQSIIRGAYGCIDLQLNLAEIQLDVARDITIVLCPNKADGNFIEWKCGYESSTFADYITYLPADCQNSLASVRDTSF